MTDAEKEKAIIRFLVKFPGYSNDRIAYIFNHDLKRVDELRLQSELEGINVSVNVSVNV